MGAFRERRAVSLCARKDRGGNAFWAFVDDSPKRCKTRGRQNARGKEPQGRGLAPASQNALSLYERPLQRSRKRRGEHSWNVVEIIPVSALFRSNIESFDGKLMRANFNKCGDELPTPHFLSWSPIEWKEPSFHRPEQFGELIFE